MNPTNEPLYQHGGPMTIKIGPVSNPEPEYSIRAAKELSEARERIEGLEGVIRGLLPWIEFGHEPVMMQRAVREAKRLLGL